ncbi:hypothetical protein [Bordetella sp. LUAb4]|uniref:hypothetical protein n=1 Tax=Bordetella sp. LUAb4 TaxID=2843195 RepID=UPI001E3EEC80|nr:hypothetical protein [Bordetella sp. LUAb4]
MIGLNNVREVIRILAEIADSPFSEDEWSIDYASDLNNLLHGDLAGLQNAADLLSASLKERDLVTAVCALIRLRLYVMQISNSFANIGDDIEKNIII